VFFLYLKNAIVFLAGWGVTWCAHPGNILEFENLVELEAMRLEKRFYGINNVMMWCPF
jgi:hypothetical protein